MFKAGFSFSATAARPKRCVGPCSASFAGAANSLSPRCVAGREGPRSRPNTGARCSLGGVVVSERRVSLPGMLWIASGSATQQTAQGHQPSAAPSTLGQRAASRGASRPGLGADGPAYGSLHADRQPWGQLADSWAQQTDRIRSGCCCGFGPGWLQASAQQSFQLQTGQRASAPHQIQQQQASSTVARSSSSSTSHQREHLCINTDAPALLCPVFLCIPSLFPACINTTNNSGSSSHEAQYCVPHHGVPEEAGD